MAFHESKVYKVIKQSQPEIPNLKKKKSLAVRGEKKNKNKEQVKKKEVEIFVQWN